MLDRIILSRDRKTATVVFTDRGAINFHHSEGKVMELVQELILDPITKWEERRVAAEEPTEKIELQLSFNLDNELAA